MSACAVVDAFPTFLSVWDEIGQLSLDAQLDGWLGQYMAGWPELLQKQIDNYASEELDWRAVASEHVFPFLPERLPLMQTAHRHLLDICADVFSRSQQLVQFDGDLVCVLYVGIGCGAGWASTYDDKPAILFGLENIAEEGWQERTTLEGLMAHELGHLIHFEWRRRANLAQEVGPWWQLYTEGFAQQCESLLLGRASWHMQSAPEDEWIRWCQANLGWLAAEFLGRVDRGEDIRPFFGSWFDLRGKKQTGYFLGQAIINLLQEQMDLQSAALLSDPAVHLRPLLVRLAS